MAWWNKKNVLEKEIAGLKNELRQIKNDISMNDSTAFKEMFTGGGRSVSVTSPDVAMRCSAVFACVRLIAGAIASSPLLIHKNGIQATNHQLGKILGLRPNDNITAAIFWKTMASNKVLNGNAYAAIIRSTGGAVIGLIPLKPVRVTPYQAWELGFDNKLGADKYRLFYSVVWDNGTSSILDQDDMLHIPNIGWDGKKGLSTIMAGSQAMGLALSAEESAAKLFENGMISQLALTYPQKMGKDAQELLRTHLAERHSGSGNHHKPLILTEGGDVKTMSMNAEDAQLLQTRIYSVIDIARFFGVPPVMIGETEKTSSWGSGVEQMAMWFVMFTLNDHLTDIEQEIQAKLFRGTNFSAKFDQSELTRGDTKTRAEYFRAALGGTQNPGWMTPNEARRKEGEPPHMDASADKLYTPQQGGNNQPQGAPSNA